MPGFNIGGGGGGSEPSNSSNLNRNHRWRIISLGESIIPRTALIFVKSLQLPAFTVEEEIVTGAAIKYKFAKTVNWEDVLITFYDNVGLIDDLLKWQKLVYDSGAGIKLANDYKKSSSFELTDGAGKSAGSQYFLINSWPKNISHSQLSYEDSEIKLVNMTLSYDWAEIFAGTASG
jgi:hypothetical protein